LRPPRRSSPSSSARSSFSTVRPVLGAGAPRKPPGRLPDLFRAEKYDEAIAASDAILPPTR